MKAVRNSAAKIMKCYFKELLEALVTNNNPQFGSAYIKCLEKLIPYCKGFTKDNGVAEDIASSAIMKLWAKKEEAREINNCRSWLFTVARNDCITYISKNKKHKKYLQQIASIIEKPAIYKSIDKDFWNWFLKIKLTDREYSIFSKSLAGLSNEEIADELDSAPKTIANIKSQAKKKLQILLQEFNQKSSNLTNHNSITDNEVEPSDR